jgi:hypothetical protein
MQETVRPRKRPAGWEIVHGREPEQKIVRDLLQRAQRRIGGAVLIDGEPGIGRSLFEGLSVEPGIGQTALVGEIRDQSHLYGVLDLMRELGLDLVSVETNRGTSGPDDEENARLKGSAGLAARHLNHPRSHCPSLPGLLCPRVRFLAPPAVPVPPQAAYPGRPAAPLVPPPGPAAPPVPREAGQGM